MLADLLTIAQHRGGVDALPGKTIAYLGDSANNMANSYLLSGATAGMNVRIAGPFGYLPDPAIVADAERIAAENGGSILVTTDPREAVADATASSPTRGCRWERKPSTPSAPSRSGIIR